MKLDYTLKLEVDNGYRCGCCRRESYKTFGISIDVDNLNYNRKSNHEQNFAKLAEYKKICRLAYYKISDLQKIFDVLFYSNDVPCLQRKKLKFEETLNAGKNESVEVKDFMRNGKLVKGFSRERTFEDGRRSSQNRKKKEKEESE